MGVMRYEKSEKQVTLELSVLLHIIRLLPRIPPGNM